MRILESYPGEFQELGPDAMEEKLHKALAQLAPMRGGELQLIADLADEMGIAYAERMRKMLDDFADLEESGEA
jgi:hypothetical protein